MATIISIVDKRVGGVPYRNLARGQFFTPHLGGGTLFQVVFSTGGGHYANSVELGVLQVYSPESICFPADVEITASQPAD